MGETSNYLPDWPAAMRWLEISLPGHAVPGVGLRRPGASAQADRRPKAWGGRL